MQASPRIILATLNARYIHASLGLRYLLANLERYGGADLRASASLHEFTISNGAEEAVSGVLAELPPIDTEAQVSSARPSAIVGFGVYVWNVAVTTEVVRRIKAARPDVCIVLGGPEVSHEWDTQEIVAMADFLITGWGDVSFPRLCRVLANGQSPQGKVIVGEQPPLAGIVLPYDEYRDDDIAHRLLYVEASRGCPFRCAFCLSALDRTAWAFPLTPLLDSLDRLHRRGARSFKFVDRTFNLRIDHALKILQFFLDRLDERLFVHFELIPDRLPETLKEKIAAFPPGVLQFEIGVQSFDPQVQRNIDRRQDNAATVANLDWLKRHSHAHLHADLIFGLPGETLEGFAKGFDMLYALGPQEIQLGILKRLRGAPITALPEDFGLRYEAQPPYAVQETAAVDAATMQRFTRLARYWDLLASSGRFPATMPRLLEGPSPFFALLDLSDWLWARFGLTHRLSPEMLVDALFDYLTGNRGWTPEAARELLRGDYTASGARGHPACLKPPHKLRRRRPSAWRASAV